MRRLLQPLLLGIFLLSLPPSPAGAQPRTPAPGREFSAVAVAPADDRVYAAFKTARDRFEIRSSLVEVPAGGAPPLRASRARPLPLPPLLRERELRFLFPIKGGVLVVSQWTIEQGDELQVHQWFRARRVWKDLGKVSCPSPISAQLLSEGLRFECEENTGKVMKILSLSTSGPGPDSPLVVLPQTESTAGPLSATLQGPPWHWDSLKITTKTAGKPAYSLDLPVLTLPQ